MIKDSAEYQRFIALRTRITDRLAETAGDVDAWLVARQASDPSITELGFLEGVLSERRDLLRELADLDDGFVSFLLNQRTRPS